MGNCALKPKALHDEANAPLVREETALHDEAVVAATTTVTAAGETVEADKDKRDKDVVAVVVDDGATEAESSGEGEISRQSLGVLLREVEIEAEAIREQATTKHPVEQDVNTDLKDEKATTAEAPPTEEERTKSEKIETKAAATDVSVDKSASAAEQTTEKVVTEVAAIGASEKLIPVVGQAKHQPTAEKSEAKPAVVEQPPLLKLETEVATVAAAAAVAQVAPESPSAAVKPPKKEDKVESKTPAAAPVTVKSNVAAEPPNKEDNVEESKPAAAKSTSAAEQPKEGEKVESKAATTAAPIAAKTSEEVEAPKNDDDKAESRAATGVSTENEA